MMKRLSLLLALLILPSLAQAQILGSFYVWSHKISVDTTSQDSTFSVRWESVYIYSDNVDLELKIGAPDTTGWSQRPWILLPAGSALSIGPGTKLRRLEFKAVSGSGYIYFLGYKRRRQF